MMKVLLQRRLAAVAVLLLLLQPMADAQLSKPIAQDANMGDTFGNKFLAREATADERVHHGEQ